MPFLDCHASGVDELADETLVARIVAGESSLFGVLVRRYRARLYRIAYSIVRDPDEAVDVLQEAYLNAYAHIAAFSNLSRFSTWLTRITINEALWRLRRRRRLLPVGGLDTHLPLLVSEQPGPEQFASNGELRELLERAIGNLPDPFRTTFMLRAVEELSVAEAARTLGIPEETVKTRHHRARVRLKSALEGVA